MVAQELSCGKIAQKLSRSKNAIVVEVRNGGKDKYNAIEAQKGADKRKTQRIQGLRKGNVNKKSPAFKMKQRIESLEMQVELLYNKIKELTNK